MEKLISKVTKPKALKSYPFYSIDEMFAVLPDEQLIHDAAKDLPPSPLGSYLGFCFIDGSPLIAITAYFNQETNEYEWIKGANYFIPIEKIETLKARLIKPNKKLMQHPVIKNIRRFYGSIVGIRATRLYRWCDEDRFYGLPDTLYCVVLDEENRGIIEQLPVKDISYAGNKLWHGTLALDAETLPLRKDDEVALTAMRYKDNNQNVVERFAIKTGIELDKPNILIMPYAQKEDATRKFYTFFCPSCVYAKTFYLGRGANSEREFDIILSNLNEYGAEPFVYDSLIDAGEVPIDFRRELYHCKNCGQIETKFKMRYILKDITVSMPYFCSECGESLTQVKPAEIKKLECPTCKETLKIKESGKWDIVPPEDGNYW